MGARMGEGGARVGARPSPWKKISLFLFCYLLLFFLLLDGLLATCSYFATFMGAFFHHVGTFSLPFLYVRGPYRESFLSYPPPTKISAGAHEYKYGIASH